MQYYNECINQNGERDSFKLTFYLQAIKPIPLPQLGSKPGLKYWWGYPDGCLLVNTPHIHISILTLRLLWDTIKGSCQVSVHKEFIPTVWRVFLIFSITTVLKIIKIVIFIFSMRLMTKVIFHLFIWQTTFNFNDDEWRWKTLQVCINVNFRFKVQALTTRVLYYFLQTIQSKMLKFHNSHGRLTIIWLNL